MENIIDLVKETLAVYGLRVIAALAIFIVGRWVAGWLRGLLRKLMAKSGTDPMLISFVTNMAYFALLAFVVIAALGQLGIQTTSFIAILGESRCRVRCKTSPPVC